MSSTLILTRPDVERLLDRDALFAQIKRGFTALATVGPEYRGRRHPVRLPAPTGGSAGMVLAPGLIPGIPAYTVKVNSKFPGHPPAIKGVVVLHSLEDGRIMAILDSAPITLAPTAVAGAVGADELARRDAETVAIIGCGVQGRAQLEWMTRIRPIKQAYLYDMKVGVARALADEAGSRLGIDVEEDWENVQLIVDALGPESLEWQRIAGLLEQHPAIRQRMAVLNRAEVKI